MKKSAPVRKFRPPYIKESQPSQSISINQDPKTENHKEENDTEKSRNTSAIVSILKQSSVVAIKENVTPEEEQTPNQEVENSEVNKPNPLYNIVWRKITTKKHKTWEGDGTLELINNTAIIKNEDSQEIGRIVVQNTLTEGQILRINGKEIEIGSSVKKEDNSLKRPLEDRDSNGNSGLDNCKKAKKYINPSLVIDIPNSNSLLSTPTSAVTKMVNLDENSNLFVLPEPPLSHQWEFNKDKKPVVQVTVDNHIAKVLRPHQRLGLLFLYECVMGYKKAGNYGAILADEMGLGKTLQCIGLIWTLLKRGPYGGTPVIKRIIVVTPSSLTGNWQKEFTRWLGQERIRVFVVDTKHKPKEYLKLPHVPVLIISYEMYVRSAEDLNNVTFDLLVCDEGHRLKNSSIKAAVQLAQLKCKRRIILTGTPIQNDLQEFYSLTNFVNPGCLGSAVDYYHYYEKPIVNSREPDANEDIKTLGLLKARELNKKTNYFILRRTQDLLDKYLPTKTETVIFCKLSALQKLLYSEVVEFWHKRLESKTEVAHLTVLTVLKKICNHPQLLKGTNQQVFEHPYEENLINYMRYLLDNYTHLESIRYSEKFKVLSQLLENLSSLKEKLVIVSSFTQTLDLIGNFCKSSGYSYTRLDGSTPIIKRMKIVDDFNSNCSTDLVFLLSAKAGGVGLNLVGASRLVLFDSDWNPATDLQAMSRVWRDGQKKSVYLYRFLTVGTIEEKIYQRQISKTGLSSTIVDPSNKKSVKMSDEELKDLFSTQFDYDCFTHVLLNCQCSCDGSIPEPNKDEDENESATKKTNDKNLRMNQLMQWEHHKKPINVQIMKELGFNENCDEITFIFRNKCSL